MTGGPFFFGGGVGGGGSESRPLEHDHTPEAIRRRVEAGPGESHLRDWVYGGIDGAVTTFAVVAGVAGADLPASIVLVLGFANVLADGYSMAAGNYTSTRVEQEELDYWKAVECRHIQLASKGE